MQTQHRRNFLKTIGFGLLSLQAPSVVMANAKPVSANLKAQLAAWCKQQNDTQPIGFLTMTPKT